MIHTLHYSVELPQPQETVFSFFADVAHLQAITPPELDFTVITPLPVTMATGTLLEFRLSLFGVPFGWTTEISAWEPPHRFIDRQLVGPYTQWIHRHTFRPGTSGGTVMDDDVTYELPASPLGELAYPLVRRELEKIFTFRRETILRMLATAG